MKTPRHIPLELIFWIVALVLLACAAPHEKPSSAHFTICPLANLGLGWCPGCGIGRAITLLFHGNFQMSMRQHWFGVPAVLILLYRIAVLFKMALKKASRINLEKKENNYV